MKCTASAGAHGDGSSSAESKQYCDKEVIILHILYIYGRFGKLFIINIHEYIYIDVVMR